MQPCSRRHRIARVIPVSVAAALLVACCSSTSVAAPAHVSWQQATPNLAGTWSGHYGGATSGTFTLHSRQSGSTLRGWIGLEPSRYVPHSGNVRGSKISFGAVGVGATYAGTVSGRSMSGTWKSGNRGGSWSAHKTSS